jgi:spermidine synthase
MKSKWFFPKFAPYEKPYEKTGILIKNKILSIRTKYQKLEILDSYLYGKVLVLDGIIQTAEKGEFFYHEMLVNLPLIYHGNVESVLIIGGGDGGALKEVLKHTVKEVHMAEIDGKVIEMSRKYLPSVSKSAFDDKRTKLFVGDGIEFVKKFKDYFDAVIIDLTDPSGPSQFLFSPKFYRSIFLALKKDGIVITQSGSFPSQTEEINMVKENMKQVFPFVKTHLGLVPQYGIGLFSYTIGSKKSLNVDLKTVKKRFEKLKIDTKYYTPEIHLASGALPKLLK